jgi:hypothetical protein
MEMWMNWTLGGKFDEGWVGPRAVVGNYWPMELIKNFKIQIQFIYFTVLFSCREAGTFGNFLVTIIIHKVCSM